MITEKQYKDAATSIGCEVAAVKAVNKVESSGSGFLANGKPKILFEGHIFWKQLLALGIDPKPLQKGNEAVLYPTWDRAVVTPLYKMDQYARLEQAKAINKDAALKSASWGALRLHHCISIRHRPGRRSQPTTMFLQLPQEHPPQCQPAAPRLGRFCPRL